MERPAALPHVVIVGGGFGGLYAARALAHRPVRVTLLDRRNHHLFQPLLYQVATAALNASDIAVPLRSVLRRATNVTVLLAEVEAVDLANRRLVLDRDRKSTRLNSSHRTISYAVFCLKKKKPTLSCRSRMWWRPWRRSVASRTENFLTAARST